LFLQAIAPAINIIQIKCLIVNYLKLSKQLLLIMLQKPGQMNGGTMGDVGMAGELMQIVLK
jgi:hypothetical protein